MHVWHVEIVALVAPALVQDLFELFLRLEIHPQRYVQTSLSGSWRSAISVNQKQRRGRRSTSWGCGTAIGTSASSRCAIDELMTIRTNLVAKDAGNESRRSA